MHRGYLPVWRKFFEHPFWKEKRKFSKAEAWIDILANTHFREEPKTRLIRGRIVIVNYGECVMTTRYCGMRWGWHNSAVHRFIKTLSTLEQITVKIEQQMQHITVLNFEQYDPKRNGKANGGGTVTERKRNGDGTNLKNDKTVKNDKELPPSPPIKNGYSESFEKWWEHYPKKINKKAAFKKWKTIGKKKEATVGELIDAVKAQVENHHFRGKDGEDYIPGPDVWLNKGKWADEVGVRNQKEGRSYKKL